MFTNEQTAFIKAELEVQGLGFVQVARDDECGIHFHVVSRNKATGQALAVSPWLIEFNPNQLNDRVTEFLCRINQDIINENALTWFGLVSKRIPFWQFLFLHEVGHAKTMTGELYDEELRLAMEAETPEQYRSIPAERLADTWALARLQELYS